MRFPYECCQIHQTLRQRMPHLIEARTNGFALWGARNDNRPKGIYRSRFISDFGYPVRSILSLSLENVVE